jgi:hypothetical protein
MTTHQKLGGITVELPPPWADFTDEMGEGAPWTLCRPEVPGGALQFTIGLYRGGRAPNPSAEDLIGMALDFGARNGLGEVVEQETFVAGPLNWATVSFHKADDDLLWRLLYGSDGHNLVAATYVCDWARRDEERADVDAIIRSVRFIDEHAQAA